MKTLTRKGVELVFWIICFFALSGCVPTSENIDLIAPEEVVTVVASRIPIVKPTSPVITTPTPLASPQPRFIYVIEVRPPENGLMTLSEFNSTEDLLHESQSVCVEAYIRSIIQPGVELSYETIVDHINLQVDGAERPLIWMKEREINDETQDWIEPNRPGTYFSSPSPSIICWQADLSEGVHQATFQVRQIDGNVLSYSWYFELTGDE